MSCDKKMSFEECELAILRSAVDKIGKKTGRKKINNPEIKDIIQISHGQFSTEDNIENFARTVSNSYLAKRRSR